MNNYVRFAPIDLDHISARVAANDSPDDIGQELTELLNEVMPLGVSVDVTVELGYNADMKMRDGMTGAETAEEEFELDSLQGLRRHAQQMLDDLEVLAAAANVGLDFIPFDERTHDRNANSVREALQGQFKVGVLYAGTTAGIAIYRVGPIPEVFVGVQMSNAHAWASVLDERVCSIPAMRK